MGTRNGELVGQEYFYFILFEQIDDSNNSDNGYEITH